MDQSYLILDNKKYIGVHCPKIFKIVRLHINLNVLIEKEKIQIGVHGHGHGHGIIMCNVIRAVVQVYHFIFEI